MSWNEFLRAHYGYSLHAERIVNSDDRDGLEKLCRYASRAPITKSRLSLDESGQVVVKLKRPLRDGRRELRVGQVELLQKLAILIPPPHKNLTRYFGVFRPAHRNRAAVVGMGRGPFKVAPSPDAAVDERPTPRRQQGAYLDRFGKHRLMLPMLRRTGSRE